MLRICGLALLLVGGVAQEEGAVRSFRKRDHLYFQKTPGRTHCRCRSFTPNGATGGSCDAGAEVEVLLDESSLADGERLGALVVSPDEQLVAYTHGSPAATAAAPTAYSITVKDLDTDAVISDSLSTAHPQVVWGAGVDGGRVLYYIKPDGGDGRPAELWRHVPGDSDSDQLLLREDDVSFQIALSQTTDERWLLVNIESSDSSEVHILRLDEPASEAGQKLQIVAARTPDTKYDVDIHHESHLTDWHRKIYQSTIYIRTTYEPHPRFKDVKHNFRIMKIGMTDVTQGMKKWRALGCVSKDVCYTAFPFDQKRPITGMKVFKDHLVVQGWQADGDTRTFKTWVSELNDHDDRVILIHEMEHPTKATSLVTKGQSLVMDTIQGYESGAVRLRVMAPDGMGVASNENGGENTFELPFPSPSEIEPQDQQSAGSVQDMFKPKAAKALPILDNVALVDEALEPKSGGARAKQEL